MTPRTLAVSGGPKGRNSAELGGSGQGPSLAPPSSCLDVIYPARLVGAESVPGDFGELRHAGAVAAQVLRVFGELELAGVLVPQI